MPATLEEEALTVWLNHPQHIYIFPVSFHTGEHRELYEAPAVTDLQERMFIWPER